jgi:selenocysteine lyase/cysteine desulfurase
MKIPDLRADTPGCADHIHLNNAGSSLMPAPVVRAMTAHIELEAQVGGYEAAAERREAIRAAYDAVAGLVGTRAGNIAFTDSATTAYIQALSSIPFEPGDVILTTRNDYVSNQIQFLSLQARLGVRIVRAPDRPEGGVDLSAIADAIRRDRPKLVCVTHVPTNSGLVQDVAAVGAACREAGVWYLVDACQSVGQMPIDAAQLGCDFLSGTFRKFLRGPRGTGFLYVSDRVLEEGLEPLYIDMRGADWVAQDRYRAQPDASRFETWEFAFALVLGAGEAARYARAVGLDNIRDRVRALASRLRQALGALDRVRILDRGPELCGIVSVTAEGWDPRELVVRLRDRGISAGAQLRAVALIDYDDKGVSSSLRLSPHYYNTEAEIDHASAVLEELLSPPRKKLPGKGRGP